MDSGNRTSADLQRLISSLPEFLSLADPDVAQMHPLQRAESMLVLVKAASSLLSLRLGCAGVNPADHSIKSELERISLYEAKLERFMDLNEEESEWTRVLERMLVQEKALKEVNKRKRGEEEDIVIISSSSAKESSAAVPGREMPSRHQSSVGEELVQRPRKILIKTPNVASAFPPAPQEPCSPKAELNSLVVPELVGSHPSGPIEPVWMSPAPQGDPMVEDLEGTSSAPSLPAEKQQAGRTEEVPLPPKSAPIEGGFLNDIEAQLCFTEILQHLRGELPRVETREDLFACARYYSLLGAVIPGMLMDAWREERSQIPKLKSQVKCLTKKRNNWRKQRRSMRANIQDLKSQVDAVEEEINDSREEVETLKEQLAAEKKEREDIQASWAKKFPDLKRQLEAERAQKEELQAQWTSDRDQLQRQAQESSLGLSQAAAERAQEIERAKLKAVEDFKSSDAFTDELVSRSGKAIKNSLRSVKGDLERLYPSVDLSMVPGLDYLRQLDEVRCAASSP